MIGTAGITTFNSFNPFIIKGDAAQGMELLFDSLMTRAYDEPDAVYGLVAHSAKLEPDRSGVTFYMRPEARFADGSSVTAEDVVFTYETLKREGRPIYNAMLRDVEKAEALDDHTVRFTFDGPGKRRLPMMIAELPILSKAYYKEQPFNESTLTPPIGSGPYEIADFKQGSFVTLRRRNDYWGWDLPVNQGRYNLGELRYEYFRDRTAELEALKAGEFDLREEFTSKSWATEYDIAQVRSGRMKLLTLEDDRPSGAQGFFINTRREQFADRSGAPRAGLRVRLRVDEQTSFSMVYERTQSFFENSAEGRRQAERSGGGAAGAVSRPTPESVFRPSLCAPKSNGSGQRPAAASQGVAAAAQESGWIVRDGQRVNAESGEQLTIEFLIFSPTFERSHRPVYPQPRNARHRRIDPQGRSIPVQQRMKSFKFDITTRALHVEPDAGPGIAQSFGSAAAGANGSSNIAGISSPAIDALVDKVLAAGTREELRTAAHALDRVFALDITGCRSGTRRLASHRFLEQVLKAGTKPPYDRGVIETWWYDADKAARLEQAAR